MSRIQTQYHHFGQGQLQQQENVNMLLMSPTLQDEEDKYSNFSNSYDCPSLTTSPSPTMTTTTMNRPCNAEMDAGYEGIKWESRDMVRLETEETYRNFGCTEIGNWKMPKEDAEKWLVGIHESEAKMRELMVRNVQREADAAIAQGPLYLSNAWNQNKYEKESWEEPRSDLDMDTGNAHFKVTISNSIFDEIRARIHEKRFFQSREVDRDESNYNGNCDDGLFSRNELNNQESYEDFLESLHNSTNSNKNTDAIDQDNLGDDDDTNYMEDDRDSGCEWVTTPITNFSDF